MNKENFRGGNHNRSKENNHAAEEEKSGWHRKERNWEESKKRQGGRLLRSIHFVTITRLEPNTKWWSGGAGSSPVGHGLGQGNFLICRS